MVGLVGRRGFEPLISALRGRCPGPLDERPTIAVAEPLAHKGSAPTNIANGLEYVKRGAVAAGAICLNQDFLDERIDRIEITSKNYIKIL